MLARSWLRRWARIVAATALLAAGLLASPAVRPAYAQTITVTTTAEAPGGTGDCTLGEAVQASNSLGPVDACPAGSGDDIIELANGATYTLTTAAASEHSAFLISRHVTLQGHGARLAHDPLGAPLRFFTMTASSGLTLINLTLAGGLAQGANGLDGSSDGMSGTPGQSIHGGAINSLGGEIVLDGVTFVNNSAMGGRGGSGFAGASVAAGALGGAGVGGAIFSAGFVTLHTGGAHFTGNHAQGGKGGNGGLLSWPGGNGGNGSAGAIYAISLDATNGPLTVDNNLAQAGDGGNGTPGGSGGGAAGGGLFVSTGHLAGATLTGNRAQGGVAGALSFNANSAGGYAEGGAIVTFDFQLMASRLISNTALGGVGPSGGPALGGGLYKLEALPISLQGDVILNNLATGGQGYDASGAGGYAQGGGVTVLQGDLTLVQSAVAGNVAQGGADPAASTVATSDGGGLYLYTTGALTNTTVALNQAKIGGGLESGPGTIQLVHTTVVSNSASVYGGLDGGDLRLRNSVVAYNTLPGCSLGILAFESNMQTPGSSCAGATVADPRLLPVRDNGGQTLTAALRPDSPALDAGAGAYCPPTDQRGFKRPIGAGCDLGAYERGLDLFLPLVRR